MIATVTAVTAIALGAAFAAVSVAFMRAQRQELDARLLHVARAEARELPGQGFSFTSGPGPAESDVGPMVMAGILYDGPEHIAATTPPFDRTAPHASDIAGHGDGECFDFRFEGQHFRGVFLPLAGHPEKRLLLAESREELDGDEQFLVRAMLTAFLLAVAWAAAVASWRAGELTREQHGIADMVRRFAEGELDARVRFQSGDRETAQLVADINDMADKIAALVSTQRRFVANAAHELRSPLTRLYGELQLALRKDRTAPEYKEAITQALEATRRLKALTDDLLTIARHTSEEVGAEKVAVTEVVRHALELIATTERDRVKVAGDDCVVRGHPADLARMLRNLVENALTYSRPGSTVHVRLSRVAGAVNVEVADEGEGVPESLRGRIFEPFVRASRSGSGTGLGLGIAREIARAHAGEVSLTRAEGGATFVVTLPDASPPTASASTGAPSDRPSRPTAPSDRSRPSAPSDKA
jgi:two-component system heavy metal sensor histidine kinase CusS